MNGIRYKKGVRQLKFETYSDGPKVYRINPVIEVISPNDYSANLMTIEEVALEETHRKDSIIACQVEIDAIKYITYGKISPMERERKDPF